jgi:hypothetical protein
MANAVSLAFYQSNEATAQLLSANMCRLFPLSVMGNPFIFINSAPEVVKNKMFE